MVRLISKVSKGSRMDQIYIPKNRTGFGIGSHVVVQPLEAEYEEIRLFFYNVDKLEQVKVSIIKEIFREIDNLIDADNILITGSFLEKGFQFNDIDIVIISREEIETKNIEKAIEEKTGIYIHVIPISYNALIKGISTDPLFRLMLSKCVSKTRFIFKAEPMINFKLLDIHLLKSKLMIDNFEVLTGNEKYNLVRNMLAIKIFIEKKKLTKEGVNKEIDHLFGKDTVRSLKENLISKKDFLPKYKRIYNKISETILKGFKDGSKQK